MTIPAYTRPSFFRFRLPPKPKRRCPRKRLKPERRCRHLGPAMNSAECARSFEGKKLAKAVSGAIISPLRFFFSQSRRRLQYADRVFETERLACLCCGLARVTRIVTGKASISGTDDGAPALCNAI